MLQLRVETLLWRKAASAFDQFVPGRLGKPGVRPRGDVPVRDVRPCLFCDRARLHHQRQAGAHRNANQQFQRKVVDPAIHNPAQRGLRDIQPPRCFDLTRTSGAQMPRDLQSHIAAQGMNGCEIHELEDYSKSTIITPAREAATRNEERGWKLPSIPAGK